MTPLVADCHKTILDPNLCKMLVSWTTTLAIIWNTLYNYMTRVFMLIRKVSLEIAKKHIRISINPQSSYNPPGDII